MARLAERKAAAESEYDATAAKLWDEYQLTVSQAEEVCVEFDSLPALRAQVADLRGKIRALGNVNVSAIEEYQEVKARYDALRVQVEDVEGSKNELGRMIANLSAQMREIFTDSFRAINENFGRVFTELFGGGEASLVLEDESDVLSCGIGIRVAPPGKVIKNLEALSGGEQALVAISIYFAILAVNPAPFCILDEIEAALDDANVVRFAQYLRRVSDKTQFIVGKTTSIAKLADYYTRQGKRVMLAAGDTFRAAASEQLEIWADRAGVPWSRPARAQTRRRSSLPPSSPPPPAATTWSLPTPQAACTTRRT